MAKYLQLYLDTDFIIPIGVGDSGHFTKFSNAQGSRRLWLFFSHSSNGAAYASSETNKACFEAGKPGYLGDFWQHVDKNDNVEGEKFKYLDLIHLSSIISELREWSSNMLGTDSPELVLNFSTVIPPKARRNFAEYLRNQFNSKVRSFSIELNDLLASKVQSDYRSMAPEFGDQILLIQSSGQDILMSSMTWCGDKFMQGEAPSKLAKQGSEFLKRELVKMVVDKYNHIHTMLRQEQIQNEYAYQMQFADSWLAKRHGDNNFWVENFHFSSNPTKSYAPIEIDGKYLNTVEQDAIRETINAISKFYKENIVNRHLHTILVGDIFKEEVFLKNCISVTSSDGKYSVFNDNAVQEALGRYHLLHSNLSEDVNNLQSIYYNKTEERAKIREYVKNAERIGALRDDLSTVLKRLNNSINDIANRNRDLVASWEAYMRRSDFANALEMTNQMSISDELISAKSEATNCIKQIERDNRMLIELSELDEVKPIIDRVRHDEEELRQLIDKANSLSNLPEELKAKIQHFQDCYGRYKELRHQFDLEKSLINRKKLVEEMADLTMEELPATEIESVTGRIHVTSTETKGFLGFGAKKQITIKLVIDKPLPCRGVLIISSKVITAIPEDRYGIYAIDVEKGSEGVAIEMTAEPQALGLDKKAERLYIKFWPNESAISLNTFAFSGSGYVNI